MFELYDCPHGIALGCACKDCEHDLLEFKQLLKSKNGEVE